MLSLAFSAAAAASAAIASSGCWLLIGSLRISQICRCSVLLFLLLPVVLILLLLAICAVRFPPNCTVRLGSVGSSSLACYYRLALFTISLSFSLTINPHFRYHLFALFPFRGGIFPRQVCILC
jgi:hypothetical protein